MTHMKQESSIKYQVRETIRPTLAPLTTAIGGALAAGSLQAATITVTSLDGGFVSGECTLRSALYAASTNSTFGTCPSGDAGEDIIEFDSALAGTINLEAAQGSDLYYDGSTLPIGEDLRIYGDGRITINGTGNAPVFYGKYQADGLKAELIQFSGLTITGGGGDYGAGILSKNRNLIITDSIVTGNNASIGGGAIWQRHDGVTGQSQIQIANSEISGNQALDSSGGGGAIYAGSNSQTVRILQSDVFNNGSLGSGGAIQIEAPVFGYFNSYSNEFSNNFAKYGNGGAIEMIVDPLGVNASSRVLVRNSVFVGNEASSNGGAIAIEDTESISTTQQNISIRSSSFDDNEAGESGGAIWVRRGGGTGTPSEPNHLIEIIPDQNSGERTVFNNNVAQYSGGAIYISAGDLVPVLFEEVSFLSNESLDGDGGAGYVQAGSDGLTLVDVLFENNQALDGAGGGLQATSLSGDVLGTDVRFLNNSAAEGGGARVFSTGGDIGFERSVFTDNAAVNFYGGGLQLQGTPDRIGIGRSVLSGNSAGFGGGGLNLFTTSEGAAVEIKYSEFSGNSSSGPGGAALVSAAENSQIYLKNSTLSGNSASLGGAMRVSGDTGLEVKYSTIADNYASTGTGGLLTLLPNGCDISNSILAGNTTGPDDDPEDLRGIDDLCDVRNSLVAGKYSEFNDVTGNVLYQSPRMDPLADNGGSGGRTHALRADSPAVDAGDAAATAPSTDQRGSPFVRIFGSEVDMGAYERQSFPDAIFSDRFESP